MTPHIEAGYDDIAKTVLMPGDPLRASYIAKNYLKDVKQVNGVRGMLAFTGLYKDKKITIMASGMGMPSIGIYSYELYKFYDVQNIIRIGSCGAYTKELNLYDLVLVEESYTDSSFAYVQGYKDKTISPSKSLNKNIMDAANRLNKKINLGRIYTTDVFYGEDNAHEMYTVNNCLCTEMESFALFYNAYKLNKEAACILTVSDNLETHEETSSEERQDSFNEMIELALETAISL